MKINTTIPFIFFKGGAALKLLSFFWIGKK